MVSTTYYVDLPLLRQSLQLYETSCDKVRNCAGIVWSLTFQTIPPTVISKSPFLQAVISTLPESPTTIIIAQITGTWKNDEDTTAVEAAAVQFIEDVEKLTKAENMQTGYTYLNYAHEGQKVFGEGRRLEELRSVSRRYDPDGIFQRCVPGGFKLW
jgi:hypothetical protein